MLLAEMPYPVLLSTFSALQNESGYAIVPAVAFKLALVANIVNKQQWTLSMRILYEK